MPENETVRRRRQRPAPPQEPHEEVKEPVRIVVGAEESGPDWVVSARRPRSAEESIPPKQSAPKPGAAQAAAKADVGAKPTNAARRPVAKAASQGAGVKRSRPKGKRKLTARQRAKRNRRIGKAAVLLLLAAVAVALTVVACIGGAKLVDIKKTLDRGDSVFYNNIYVNDIPLQGMTLDQAATTVSRQVSEKVSSWNITLRTQDGQTWNITGDDLDMKYDVADQLDQLWSIGHSGSSYERYQQAKALEEGEPIRRYTKLTYDLSGVYSILTQIKKDVEKPAVNATKVYDESVFPPYTYTNDIPGITLDITGLNERICGMVERLESGTVDLLPTTVQAELTRSQLQSQIVKLSTYETAISTTSTEGRFANIQLGTSKFNHKIIKKNESVSFNKVTGKRIEKNGYQEALELAYGDYRMGWGGGICQVSSTLYNAVVMAGLKVTERHQHSLPSSYVDKGLDATVQDDRLDFVFVNNTGDDIFIETNYYKKKGYYYTQFTIYGRPDPNGYSYRLESQVREIIPTPTPEIRVDKDATYVVYDDQSYVYTKGEEGYIVDVYKVTLDSKGLEVTRELAYTDTYKPRTPVTYIGAMPRETPIPAVYP